MRISLEKIVELKIPIKLISEANTGFSLRNPKMTWIRLKKRKEEQKKAIHTYWMCLDRKDIPLPCVIKLIRIASRKMNDDNLAYCFKHIRDVLADLIRPGYAFGRADDTDQIKWEYDQEKGNTKEYGIKIEIYQ